MARLIQITDTHLFADPQKCGYDNINPYACLANVLAKVSQRQPDLLLVTGDISGDYSAQSYVNFLNLLEQYVPGIETWWIPGNHDAPEVLESLWPGRNLSERGPLTLGTWRIHGLNSRFEGARGAVDPQQLKRLDASIDASPERCHLIAVHHHPLPSDSWMDKHEWTNRQQFLDLLTDRPQVKGVIHGHIHRHRQSLVGSTYILSCPSTCWQWAATPDFATATDKPGFRLLELNNNGGMQPSTIRITE